MKIIIKESQYKLLVKDNKNLKLLRRITPDNVNLFVDQSIDEYAHNMCVDFSSEEEYANNILLLAAKRFFIHIFGRYTLDDYRINLIYDFFEAQKKQYLKKVFRDTCQE